MTGKKEVSRVTYNFISLLPLAFILFVSIVFPYIISVLNLFGLTIYNINAYLVPLLMKYKVGKEKGESFSSFYLIAFVIMMILSVSGTVFHFLIPDEQV